MMNKINTMLWLLLYWVVVSCGQQEGSQGKDFTAKIDNEDALIENDSALLTFFEKERAPIQPAFQAFPTGSNRPKGWLLDMMQQDLHHGIVGALDELYPGIHADDLYHTHRRGGMDDVPEMGDLVLTGAPWETSIMWWNAETIGNWWDGFVRHAYLTQDEKSIQQSKAIVERLLAAQTEDGYLGIYKPNLRYQHKGSNGELWAQTTAFRMLLAYYEITQDSRALQAVEKAMAVTMKHYHQDARNPFDLKNAFGGVTHGLMLTDVCETLHRITQNQAYQDYAVYLYQAFSTYNINRAFNDLRYPFLVKEQVSFTGHGVHTYEHFRTLLNAYHQTGYEELKTAYNNALTQLDRCLLPSGAGHAMEWIDGLDADPTSTASEYCTMLELRNFFGTAAQKTGGVSYADKAEKLTFNAMLGARNQDGTAISYGKPDNCYKLDGRSLDGEEKEVRYKYSPTHSEPAVCCVPNYTRNLTYYLDQMWGQSTDGIAAILYGPAQLKTTIKGVEVTIEQVTNYPYSDQIKLNVQTAQPIELTLYFRKPTWTKKMTFDNEEALLEDGFYVIKKRWESETTLQIAFENEVQAKTFRNGEQYFQRGPIVYALDIPSQRENIKTYELDGFHDYYCLAKNDDYKNLMVSKKELNFEFVAGELPSLKGTLVDDKTKELKNVNLKPMGQTILRKVTFPVQE
ncbi:MAG: beta-L-arabinofuranosidase domain-containing protein [Bacteroidota bacterium]